MTTPVIYVRSASADYHLAHVPVLPGCIGTGKTRDEAIANARRAYGAYLEMLAARGVTIDHWKGLDPHAFAVADVPAGGLLPEDERPVEEHELRDFLHAFEAQQAALIAALAGLSADELERAPDEKTWSVRQALEHAMNTEVGLLSRLERWPDDPFNTFQAVHRLVAQRFAVMDANDANNRKTIAGTTFTVRRVMRRLLEHKWEHFVHVQEIIDALGRNPKA
jgi:predicted RNase H-like HicB family nuclease